MNFEIVEIEELSGQAAKVYSIIPEGGEETLFEKFVEEYRDGFRSEIREILTRIRLIGDTTGARESFFKHEGDNQFVRNFGRHIWALYDKNDKKLRLYCIRFSNVAIILGGGGFKEKTIKKWQESPKLSEEVQKVMKYAEYILKQMDKRELRIRNDGSLDGILKNYGNE